MFSFVLNLFWVFLLFVQGSIMFIENVCFFDGDIVCELVDVFIEGVMISVVGKNFEVFINV